MIEHVSPALELQLLSVQNPNFFLSKSYRETLGESAQNGVRALAAALKWPSK